MKKLFLSLLCLGCLAGSLTAQVNTITPDHVYMDNIKSIKLSPAGNALQLPVINLNSSQKLALGFDDLDGNVKNYYYTLILCNTDWKPAGLNPFDYLEGFLENRIDDYHYSTLPLQKYVHYTLQIPNQDCKPTLPGNYLLKVYLNGDTSQLAFTRRLMVTTNKAIIHGKIEQPVNPKIFRTHQKIDFDISLQGINVNNPLAQIKVFILQNGRWDNAIRNLKPTFIRGDKLIYNTEDDCVFPAMKEWRWVNLRSFRLQTERVKNIENTKNAIDVYLMPDGNRSHHTYVYRRDIDGQYFPDILENGYNPAYEGDYAKVHFTFVAPQPFAGSEVYVFGEFTNYECNKNNRMTYNGTKGTYEATLYLKQGYYNYIYGIIPNRAAHLQTKNTEGNWWETENNYTILVYYKPLGGRSDQLIGIRTLNSLAER